MKITRVALTSGLAMMAVAGSTAAVLAAPAIATGGVNVRTGAGTQYAVVDQLQPGEPVDVGQCQGSWCYITHNGPDGWVSSNFLAAGGAVPDEEPVPDEELPPPSDGPVVVVPGGNDDPSFNFGFSFGNGGQFSFGIGQQPQPVAASACFYEGSNYSGGGICVEEGERYGSLGEFGNRISSVRVFGGATATICSDPNLFGTCQTLSGNHSQLGILNNAVSSLEVY